MENFLISNWAKLWAWGISGKNKEVEHYIRIEIPNTNPYMETWYVIKVNLEM